MGRHVREKPESAHKTAGPILLDIIVPGPWHLIVDAEVTLEFPVVISLLRKLPWRPEWLRLSIIRIPDGTLGIPPL
jgi:hypothetical protein